MAKKRESIQKQNWMEQLAPYILLLLPFILYANTLQHGFVLDDRAVIFQNKFVQQGIAGIGHILTTFYWQGYWEQNSGLYRPLSLIMFAVEWQLSPDNPFIHHLVQVLLYSLSGFLLYKLLKKVFYTQSYLLPFFATLLFLAHPVHTEVVANIKSRDEILCFLFFVVTANILLSSKELNWPTVASASATYLLCLLSKEGGILFLPVLFLLVIWLQQVPVKKALIYFAPIGVLTVAWLGWHTYVVNIANKPAAAYTYLDNSLVACGGLLTQAGTGLSMLGRYMLKCLWPYQLSYDYSFNEIACVSLFSLQGILPLLLVVSLLLFAYKYRAQFPQAAFGVVFFLVTIALTTNIFLLIGATMADRFLYTPVLGFIIALVSLLYYETKQMQQSRFLNNPAILLLPLLFLYSYKTITRNVDWKSDKSLFAADVNSAKGSARVYYNYGSLLLNEPVSNETEKQNNLNECIRLFESAAAIDAQYPNTFTNLGVAYYRKKNYAAAIKNLARAVALNPADNDATHDLADACFMDGRYDSSLLYHRLCISRNYILKETWNMVGTAYFNKKDYLQARAAFENGLLRDTTNASLYLNYGNILGVLNKPDSAIICFEKAYAINPADKTPLRFISTAYLSMGNKQQAAIYLNRYNGTQ